MGRVALLEWGESEGRGGHTLKMLEVGGGGEASGGGEDANGMGHRDVGVLGMVRGDAEARRVACSNWRCRSVWAQSYEQFKVPC